jgi:branched-chain amino acid aminotransferase
MSSVKDFAIDIQKIEHSTINQVDFDNLLFGKNFTDHMLIADYCDGAWQTPKIMPLANFSLHPGTASFHYGQAIFEGLKAHRNDEGHVSIFRMEENLYRMNRSAERMAMPQIPEDLFLEGIKKLVELDQKWVPEGKDKSLYIRPFMFSTDAYIKVKVADTYRFVVILSPAGPYFSESVKIWVETKYSRAAEGGTGFAKAAGNYGGSLYPAQLAQKKGYEQVLWLDAAQHKYIEEMGAANVFFVKNGVVITPQLGPSKLAGITRDSIITILKDWNITVEERMISIDELREGILEGSITEAFATGTAVTLGPVASFGLEDVELKLPDYSQWTIAPKVKAYLLEYKAGNVEDKFNWNTSIS